MFAARGIAISFSVFVMVYCALSVAVAFGWRRPHSPLRQRSIRQSADLLFTIRLFPLITAGVITAAFTVPSFLLLEPRAINEPLGEIPLALGSFGALLGLFGLLNAAWAMRKASRTISSWTRHSQAAAATASVPVLRISRPVPALTATGILRPKVLLSKAAEQVLTGNELRTAMSHEIAHIRRRDNLKKLALRFVAFPGMAALETAWLDATEMAADDAAVSSAGEALDLAAALIKLSRLGSVAPVDLTAALVHSPAALMNARVNRLITWSERPQVSHPRRSPWYGLSAALATIALFAVTYSQLLAHVHTATEWLVR